jgi:hypothetical protein
VRNTREEEPPVAEAPGVDLSALSRAQLYEEAKRLGLSGRSQMSKAQLIEALAQHASE